MNNINKEPIYIYSKWCSKCYPFEPDRNCGHYIIILEEDTTNCKFCQSEESLSYKKMLYVNYKWCPICNDGPEPADLVPCTDRDGYLYYISYEKNPVECFINHPNRNPWLVNDNK
jgi:hypothetical protein